MMRPLSLCLVLALLVGCGSDETKPPAGDIFSGTGGAGGTAGTGGTAGNGGADPGDASVDGEPDGAAGSGDGGIDGADDASVDGPDPNIECVEDPIPTQGQNFCITIDGDGYQCDPITSVPCNVGAGETCDFDGQRFVCMTPDFALVGPCGLCGAPYSELCIPGFTCLGLGGKCSRYCCDSLQCAIGEACVMQPPTSLGICQAKSDQILAGFVGAPPPDAGPDVVDSGPPTFDAECYPPASPGSGSCVDTTWPEFPCNPVTNAGCDASAGEACNQKGSGYACVAGTHINGICEPCTASSCVAGSGCIAGLGCVKYCCSDDDCTPGQCHAYTGLGGLGLCLEPLSPDAG